MFTLLKKQVFKEEIKDYLISMIMQGEYKSGDRLIETKIAKNLGVSQAPVREAIRDLEQMGILDIVPYRGACIRTFSIKDLKDAYIVRGELESLAIRAAVTLLTDRDIQELEEIYEAMIKADESGELHERVALDNKFHEIIVKAAQNNILEKAWRTVSITQWAYFSSFQFKEKLKILEWHQPIIEAIKERDADKAEKTIYKHFLDLQNMLDEN